MEKNKLDMKYWDSLKTSPEDSDLAAIKDAFNTEWPANNDTKDILAELILTSYLRVTDEEAQDSLNRAIGIFNEKFAVEELFYVASLQVFCTWRYNYKLFVHAIPIGYAKRAIQNIYARLGVELDDEEVMKVYNSDNIYSAFFELLAETMKDNRYIVTEDKESWLSFAFGAYFNMWHIFGPLGFNGYSLFLLRAGSMPALQKKNSTVLKSCVHEVVADAGRLFSRTDLCASLGKYNKNCNFPLDNYHKRVYIQYQTE